LVLSAESVKAIHEPFAGVRHICTKERESLPETRKREKGRAKGGRGRKKGGREEEKVLVDGLGSRREESISVCL